MADSSALFIVLFILILCIASFIVSMWTCTGGSWDFDNWDLDSCVKIPGSDPSPAPAPAPADTIPDSGGSGSGSQPDLYTSNIKDLYIEKSEHFMDCSAIFDINESQSCYNKDNNGAAVQWFFSNDLDITSTCKNNIDKIRVLITSSQPGIDNEQWWYTDLGRAVTDFYFKNAPTGFVTSGEGGTRKITFVIQALDKNEKIMVPEILQELIPETEVNDCTNLGVGDGFNWDDTMMKYVLPIDIPPPPSPPKNCEGGEWILDEDYGCQIDGEKVNIDDCGPSCWERYYLGGPNFIPSENGGACIESEYRERARDPCTGNEATVYNTPCVLSENWIATTRVGIDDYPVTEPNDLATGGYCSKPYKETPDDTAGTQLQIKTRIKDPVGVDKNGNKYVCGPEEREVKCNDFLKPIPGVCGWENTGPLEIVNACDSNCCNNAYGSKEKFKQKQYFNIESMHQGNVADDQKCLIGSGTERYVDSYGNNCSSCKGTPACTGIL